MTGEPIVFVEIAEGTWIAPSKVAAVRNNHPGSAIYLQGVERPLYAMPTADEVLAKLDEAARFVNRGLS